MIAVDTSALMAIVLGEAEADACIKVLEVETDVLVSAGTVAEALIVAARRNVGEEMTSLIDGLGFEIVTVTAASARRIAQTYEQWAKALIPPARTSATASPMKSPRSIRAVSLSARTF